MSDTITIPRSEHQELLLAKAKWETHKNSLFVKIAELLPRLHGWCSISKAETLAAAVLALRPNVTYEIGIFGGRSFLPMAMAHKEIGKGICWGIDPWMPGESAQGQVKQEDVKFWQGCDHELVYRDFIAQLVPLGIQNVVKILRATSNAIAPPPTIDILHIDGNHGEQAHTDARRFAPSVRVGGLCFLDDLDWAGGGVRKAEAVLQSIGFKLLFTLDSGALYQRLK